MYRTGLAVACLNALLLIATVAERGSSQQPDFKISGQLIDNANKSINEVQIVSFSSREPNYATVDTKSDSLGNFSIAGPANGSGSLQVLFFKPGFLCEYAESYEHERKPFVMKLEPDTPVVVEITDKKGRPMRGALVAPHNVDFGGEFAIETIDPKSSAQLGLRSETDAQGKAVLRGVNRNILWAIRVDVPGHAPVFYQLPRSQIVETNPESIKLVWESHNSKIKCTVTEADGKPARDTYLIFKSKEEDSNGLLATKATPFTDIMRKLDPNGQVELELSSSAVEISSFSFTRGIAKDLGTFVLPRSGALDLKFALPATSQILTTVLNLTSPNSAPAEGIKVTLRRKVGNRFQFASGITNEDGIAEIEVAAGEWESATVDGDLPKGFVVDPVSFRVNADTTSTVVLAPVITISKGRTIHGRIEGVDCHALRFDFIFCTYQSGISEHEAQGRIQTDGRFSIDLPHGIEDEQITNFEITHTPVTNRRSLAIMSRKTWYLALSDEACGIGVTLAEQNGKIRIARVMPNSPASRFEQIVAGVELLTLADDEHPKTELAKSTVEAAEKLIYGSVGSLLTLQIVPIGKAPKDAITVTLRRAAIHLD